eukprot:UN34563
MSVYIVIICQSISLVGGIKSGDCDQVRIRSYISYFTRCRKFIQFNDVGYNSDLCIFICYNTFKFIWCVGTVYFRIHYVIIFNVHTLFTFFIILIDNHYDNEWRWKFTLMFYVEFIFDVLKLAAYLGFL